MDAISIEGNHGWSRPIVGAGMAMAVSSMVLLLLMRGAWLDEIWTRWITDPHLSLSQALARWSFEPHPPVYYLYIWSLRHLFDGSIIVLRFSNALAIIPLLIAARDCRIRTRNTCFAYGYGAMVLLSTPVVVYFAELRAYYIVTVLYAALLLLLVTNRLGDDGDPVGGAGYRMVAAAILALATASMHYLSFAVVAITLGLEACHGLTRRAFGRSLAYLAIALLCTIVIAPSLWAYFRLGAIQQATADQGVNGSVVVGRALLLALSSNVLVLALAGYRRYASRHNLSVADMWLRDAALMAIACGGAIIASFLLLNAFKPFLTPRYLLQLSPLVCMVAASLAARCADRATMVVIAVNVLAAALAAVILQGFNRRWEYHIGIIRAEMAACPSTRLFAIDPFELGQASPPPRAGESPLQTMRAITESGYREIAARRGAALAGYLPRHPARRDLADIQGTGACPIILWLESNYWRPDIGAEELARRMGLPAAIWARYAPDVRRSGDHLLVILRARSHSPSPSR